MKIWLIEDDGFKREKIRAFLHDAYPSGAVQTARSARSAIELVTSGCPDLVILDMSLPTFDIGPDEAGGRPQGFGGVELLREMERREIAAPVIVVTQYEVFESANERMGLRELGEKLRAEHGGSFVDIVYYETASENWKLALKNAIEGALARIRE